MGSQNKALIAEPNQRLAQRIGKELEAIGLAVDYVRDGASALKELSASNYRLLLTNLILPQLSGAELVRRLRAGQATADLPICLMSPPVKDPTMVDKLCAEQKLGPYFKMPFNFGFFRKTTLGYLSGNGNGLSAVEQHQLAAKAAATPKAPAQPAQPPARPAAPAERPAAPQPVPEPPQPKAIEFEWGPDQNIRSFDQLLLRVRDKQFTGAGRIQGAGVLKMVFFSKGYPIEATPLHPPRPFQDHVRDARALKPPEMEALASRIKEPGDEVLILQMGALGLGEFLIERRDYAAEELAQCFAWNKGHVHLEPREPGGPLAGLGKLLGLPVLIATFAEGSKQFAKTEQEVEALAAKMAPHHFVRTEKYYDYAHLIPYDEKTNPCLESVSGEKPFGALVEQAQDRAAWVRMMRMLMILGMVRLSSTPAPDAEAPFPFRPFWKPAPPTLPGQATASTTAPQSGGEKLEVMDLGLDLEEDLGDFVENLREEEPVKQEQEQESGGETRKLENELIDELERVKKANYYEIFGSKKNRFKFQEVKKKYFELQGRFSPDKFVMSSGEMMAKCEEYLETIARAFETLSDVPKKTAYDQQLTQKRIITEDRKSGGGMQANIAFESARALIAEEDFASAEIEIRKAMRLAPGNLEHDVYLAWATYKNPGTKSDMSSQVRARQMLDRALVKNPRLGIAYAFRASIFLDQGKLDLAGNDLTKALKFDPQCLHAKDEQRRLEKLQQK